MPFAALDPTDPATVSACGEDARAPATRLIQALAAADRTLDELSPALKRALGHERRPLNRNPPAVRRELAHARRLAGELSRRLAKAERVLPPLPAEEA